MTALLYLAIALVTLFIVALFVGHQQSPPATPARASDPTPQPEAEPMKPDKTHRYRSAITGRYVKPAYAKRYPHLTVRERIRPRG